MNLSRIREVAIEDLLRREPVKLDDRAISDIVRGKVALVTGAGGSIGSELCRQLASFGPRAAPPGGAGGEQPLRNPSRARAELRGRRHRARPSPTSADAGRMERLFREHQPRVVFHAAAHKHVPMMEANAGRGDQEQRLRHARPSPTWRTTLGVGRFVMISTDKAVNPTSRDGRNEARRRDVSPGAVGAQRDALHHRALRQRPRVDRQRDPASSSSRSRTVAR